MIIATCSTQTYTGPVEILGFDHEVATVKAIFSAPWNRYTHGGWCYTNIATVSKHCLSDIQQIPVDSIEDLEAWICFIEENESI